MMKIYRMIAVCIFILFFAVMFCEDSLKAYAKGSIVPTPEKVVLTRQANKALKLQWKKVKDADGYRIYRYSNKQQKYVPVKTVLGNKKTEWINKGLKFHKIYKYKVAAFTVKKGKKKFSKRSYWVSGRTYAGHGRIVNAEDISLDMHGEDAEKKELCICSQARIDASAEPDEFIKYKREATKLVSDKIRWSSSDESILKINRKGEITSGVKEGTCYIYGRTHNGKTARIKVKVINYARPESFPWYAGDSEYLNILLTKYRQEVFDIATYFTIYGKSEVYGYIKLDTEGNVNGIPKLDNISLIESQIRKVISEFPLLMDIYYYKGGVSFIMNFDINKYEYMELEYCKSMNFKDDAFRIAPHWKSRWYPIPI